MKLNRKLNRKFLYLLPWQLGPYRLDFPIRPSCVSINLDSKDFKDGWKGIASISLFEKCFRQQV